MGTNGDFWGLMGTKWGLNGDFWGLMGTKNHGDSG